MTDKDREQYLEVLFALAGHGYKNVTEDDNHQSIAQAEKERKKSFWSLIFS